MEHLTVPASPTSAGVARRFALAFCEHAGLAGSVTDDCSLLVSELVSNSVVHGRSEARLRVRLMGTVLRVEVADDSELLPVQRQPSLEATGGRGVLILDALASTWGATARTEPPPGKVVWFELATA